MRHLRRVVLLMFVTMLAAVSSQTAATATATARNGICEAGEICFYYLDDLSGSLSDFTYPLNNYGASQPTCYEFKTPGLLGYRDCIKNNVRSVWNRTSLYVHIYVNSGYCGDFDIVANNDAANLVKTFDNNASHQFYPYPTPCHDV